MELLNVFKKRRRYQDIELVSLHIPKTGGTSFRDILYQVYGRPHVKRLDIRLSNKLMRLEEQPYDLDTLPDNVAVVHGHFSPVNLYSRFPFLKSRKMITWLRHPVERVISNYYYLEKRLKEELDEEGKSLDILSKMQRTLPEYARVKVNQNRISKFLRGADLNDFFFIGLMERYDRDLAQLARKLEWPDFRQVHHNRTSGAKPTVDPVVREEIEALNARDMEIYRAVLQRKEAEL